MQLLIFKRIGTNPQTIREGRWSPQRGVRFSLDISEQIVNRPAGTAVTWSPSSCVSRYSPADKRLTTEGTSVRAHLQNGGHKETEVCYHVWSTVANVPQQSKNVIKVGPQLQLYFTENKTFSKTVLWTKVLRFRYRAIVKIKSFNGPKMNK